MDNREIQVDWKDLRYQIEFDEDASEPDFEESISVAGNHHANASWKPKHDKFSLNLAYLECIADAICESGEHEYYEDEAVIWFFDDEEPIARISIDSEPSVTYYTKGKWYNQGEENEESN